MKASGKYDDLTGRSLGGRALEWVTELVNRWGDDKVSDAMEEVATSSGTLHKLLSRTSDHLARQGLVGRRKEAPPEVSGRTLLDVARGEIPEPARPYVYDTRDLSSSEYTEVMRWKERGAEAR